MKKFIAIIALGAFAACGTGKTEETKVDSTVVKTDSTVVKVDSTVIKADSTVVKTDSAAKK